METTGSSLASSADVHLARHGTRYEPLKRPRRKLGVVLLCETKSVHAARFTGITPTCATCGVTPA